MPSVATAPPPVPEPEWRSSVTVRVEPELAAELVRRFARTSGERSVGVTDLLSPRQAFWRWTSPPITTPPERQARLDAGRWLHRVLGSVLAPEGLLEVRVRRAGIVGRVDALTDRPLEVKTSSLAPGPEDLLSDRPEHVEQLAMYCALVGRSTGRLITVATHDTRVHELRSLDVRFRDLAAISAEMERRASELRSGLNRGRADELPRCRWFDRGCEFQAAKVCDCSGREPEPPSRLLEEVLSVEGRPEVDRELTQRLSSELRSAEPPRIARFRDLVYPRRAYFERVQPAKVSEGVRPAAPAAASDLYGRLVEAVESGDVGEVARLPYRTREPEEEVAAFRGLPYLVRTSRAWSALRPEQLVDRFPQYALELGFRCATTGTRSGRVILGFERAGSSEDRLKVFAFDFEPVTSMARLFRERVARLERAVAERRPATLDACPGWMFPDCPYRAECGCLAEPGRSQR
jgi:hypothetical protein